MARLEGKVCVITGASSGIGAATAERFLEEGATVVGVDLRADGAGTHPVAADVADEAQVAALYEGVRAEHGRIDVLFNNAGISTTDDGSVLETTLAAWQRVQDVNLKSVFLCCKHGIPHLIAAGGGSVINTASFVATMGSATSQISYTASKGGVLSLSRELGVEFARRGVRVNALCPGPVNTPLLRELFAKDPVAAARRLVHVPAGRFAEVHEIANAALFLASDESSYVNATAFMVDGGISQAYTTPELHAQLARQGEHAALGRGVGDLRGGRAHPGHERGGVDDRAAPLAPHVGQGGLAAEVDRGEVDVLDAFPCLQTRGEDGVVVGGRDARVVEGDVDGAVGVVRRREERVDLAGVGDVDAYEGASHLLRRGQARGLVDVAADDVGPFGRQPAGGGQADAAAGAGDDGGAAGETAADVPGVGGHVCSGLRADEDVLGFGEGREGVGPQFTAEPGLSVPAEGGPVADC